MWTAVLVGAALVWYFQNQ